MKIKLALAVSAIVLGAFASPVLADKGGAPNENSGNTTGGSQNANPDAGSNPNAGSGNNSGGGNGGGVGHDKNAGNPGHGADDENHSD